MLKPLRGLLLVASAAILPATAFADCPPESSVDRYAETARDALSALDGLVPESQQRMLEDRYAAMIVLKWEWQGGASVAVDPDAVSHIAACLSNGRCEGSTSDMISSSATALPNAPSPVLLYWAQTQLDCARTTPDELLLTDASEEEQASPVEGAEPEAPEPDAAPEPEEIVLAETTEPTDPVTPDSEDIAEIETVETDRAEDAIAADAEQALAALSERLQSQLDTAPNELDASTDSETLIQSAAALFAAGRPAAAVQPLRTACFADAVTSANSQACETLFDVYNAPTERSGGAANTPNYLALSEELCAIEYVRGCQNLARHYAGQNTAEAHLATVAYTERACSLGDGEACATASGYYLTGRATEPNPELAREKLEQSCLLGRLPSCQEAADFYLRGVGGEISIDKALQVNEASCPAGTEARPDMCVAAADFVLIHMKSGPERSALVRVFTERACAIGHDIGCAWYAEDLELGLGGEVDLAAAKKARLTACEHGHAESCNSRS